MEKLQKRGFPREIVKRIAAEYPDERTMRISHEAIYRSSPLSINRMTGFWLGSPEDALIR